MRVENATPWSNEDIAGLVQATLAAFEREHGRSAVVDRVVVRRSRYPDAYVGFAAPGLAATVHMRLPGEAGGEGLTAIAHDRLIDDKSFNKVIDNLWGSLCRRNAIPTLKSAPGDLSWTNTLPFRRDKGGATDALNKQVLLLEGKIAEATTRLEQAAKAFEKLTAEQNHRILRDRERLTKVRARLAKKEAQCSSS